MPYDYYKRFDDDDLLEKPPLNKGGKEEHPTGVRSDQMPDDSVLSSEYAVGKTPEPCSEILRKSREYTAKQAANATQEDVCINEEDLTSLEEKLKRIPPRFQEVIAMAFSCEEPYGD